MADNIQYVSIAQLAPAGLASASAEKVKKSLVEVEVYQSSTTDTPPVDQFKSAKETLSSFAIALFERGGLSAAMNSKWGLGDSNINLDLTYINNLRSKLSVAYGSTLSASHLYIGGTSESNRAVTSANISTALTNDNKLSIKPGQQYFRSTFYTLENDDYVQESVYTTVAPTSEGEEHNRYIFKVSQHTSNVYKTKAAGWFTCYGWLSEKEKYRSESQNDSGVGDQANAKRWVALEAKMNGNNWRIIQLQPFQPNNYCSYVGFGVPVCKDLELRITTGFDVGNNSGKYSMLPGSLTNHVPNAFIGGVYCYA